MAERLKRELGVAAELVPGGLGEFSIRVAGRTVLQKRLLFPSDRAVVERVRQELSES